MVQCTNYLWVGTNQKGSSTSLPFVEDTIHDSACMHMWGGGGGSHMRVADNAHCTCTVEY